MRGTVSGCEPKSKGRARGVRFRRWHNVGRLEMLQERLRQTGTDISYAVPLDGGETPPDGPNLDWNDTFAQGIERGAVPFWRHDVTPREQRARGTEENTQYRCGAMGAAGIVVEMRKTEFDRAQAALAIIIGNDGNGVDLEMGTPYDIGIVQRPQIRLRRSLLGDKKRLRLRLVLYSPRAPTPAAIEHGPGDCAVSIQFER